MNRVAQIHKGKVPIRRHYIKDWAEHRNLRPTDIADELGIDISQVTRWFAGQMPRGDTQLLLAQLFGGEDAPPELILRHPDDDWIAEFFAGRDAEEKKRIMQAMELAWPRPRKAQSK